MTRVHDPTCAELERDLLKALERLGDAAARFLLVMDEYDFGGEVPAVEEAAALDAAIGVANAARKKAQEVSG